MGLKMTSQEKKGQDIFVQYLDPNLEKLLALYFGYIELV